MASRLSEIPDWKILLLEAGPDENEISDVPALAAFLQLSRLDWQYKTEPTGKACLGMKGTNRNISRHSSLPLTFPPLSPHHHHLLTINFFNFFLGGRCNWPRGKVLGGSSVLNYMVYVRGNKKDYEHWESLGNPGWGYPDALYYFKKSEDNRNPYLARTKYHSRYVFLFFFFD